MVQHKCEQAHTLCGIRVMNQLPSVPQPAEFSLVSSPCACSQGEKPSLPLRHGRGEVHKQRVAQQPPHTAACPGTSGSLYAICTVFCHAKDLFIIYCITAVEIYFAIRGAKKKSPWPVSFFSEACDLGVCGGPCRRV